MVKVHWITRVNDSQPGAPTVPGAQHDVDLMVKDSKRFADSGGWGYGAFEYDAASNTFTPATLKDKPPQGNDAKCGFASPHGSEDKRLRFHRLRAQVKRKVQTSQEGRAAWRCRPIRLNQLLLTANRGLL